MGCCKCLEACDPCCRRIGCACRDHDGEPIASIEKNRSCTDIPCVAIFIGFIVFLVSYVWSTAFTDGDPNRLVRGVNYRGLICGQDSGVEDLPYAFWPDIESFRFKVCTDDCNAATWDNANANNIVPPSGVPNTGYRSEAYMDKYCLPLDDAYSIAGFDDYSNRVQRAMGDVETALPVIGASIAIAFVMSFAYVWLMKCCVGVLVWGTILAIIIGGALCGYVLYDGADDPNISESDADIRTYASYAIFGFTGIFTLIILFSRQRIRIAIQVIKSAGRSLGDMPMMVFFPFWPLLFTIGFFFSWVFAAIYIFSAGQKKSLDTPSSIGSGVTFNAEGAGSVATGSTYDVIDYDDTIQNAFAPHFFLLLWVVQIGVYFTFTVIAGSVADWYFTKRDENGNKLRGSEDDELSNRPVLNSCCRTSRYHLGTIIYAALIIAIIQFIRWCVRYFERVMNGGKEPNKIQKILIRIVDCMLWCLECCLDKISRNALIWTSIYGDPFCPAVCGSFKLIWSNLMRVAVITFFSAIVTTLGKVMIPLMTVGLCGLVLLYVDPYKEEIGSPVMPLVVIFIISIAISLLFLTVYDTAIDTVFMCFLIDEKQNKASGTMLADDGLKNIVQKYEAESKKLAETVQKNTNNGNQITVTANNDDGDEVAI